MREFIFIVSTIFQLLAIFLYIAIFRVGYLYFEGKLSFSIFLLVIISSGIAQLIASYLKKKYPKTDEKLSTPKNIYGIFALIFFILVVVGIIIYTALTS